jgi:hypothetical protein
MQSVTLTVTLEQVLLPLLDTGKSIKSTNRKRGMQTETEWNSKLSEWIAQEL